MSVVSADYENLNQFFFHVSSSLFLCPRFVLLLCYYIAVYILFIVIIIVIIIIFFLNFVYTLGSIDPEG